MLRSLLLSLAFVATSALAEGRTIGQETVIAFAGGGNLREWQPGGTDNGVLYVRDQNERWYKVTLIGPCRMDRSLDTLVYTTDTNGTFDRFSRVQLLGYPDTNCGVASIKTSLPPPSRRGTTKFPGK